MTTTFPGVVPVVGLTDSQLPPDAVVADALKATAPPPAIETAMVCEPGFAPPIWKTTGESDDGLTVMVGAFETVNATLITTVLAAPGEVRLICPLYVPGDNPAPFAVTVSVTGLDELTVAFVGVTVSQFRP